MASQGLFIVFEGIDGSGTSTHVHELEERIEELNKYQDVLRTHEPWKSQEIKRKLENDRDAYSGAMEMAKLYIEDRVEHTRKLIRPNLKTGVVILDSRYKMSTCAYQWTQGVSLDELMQMHEHRGLLTPDLTFFLDVPREVAQERVRGAREKLEKFEKNSEFIDKLVHAYQELVQMAEADSTLFGRVVKINGNRGIDGVANDIYKEFLGVYSSS